MADSNGEMTQEMVSQEVVSIMKMATIIAQTIGPAEDAEMEEIEIRGKELSVIN